MVTTKQSVNAQSKYWSIVTSTWTPVTHATFTAVGFFNIKKSSNSTSGVSIDPYGGISCDTNTVNGYSQLGKFAPKIKMVKLSTNTACYEGGTTSILHGLTFSKILSVNVLVERDSGTLLLPPSWIAGGENFYNFYCAPTTVVIVLASTDSANILDKPVKILIIYED